MGILAFKPDLIVLLGDTLCEKDDSEGFKIFREQLTDVLKPILESGIPFCYVLGNHEHGHLQEEQIVEAYAQYETMIGQNDPTAPRGNFNCNILVKNSAGTEDILNLWFIDSNNLAEDQSISKYDWVHEDQIEWYEKKAQEIKDNHGGRTLPAILFQHMPVIQEYDLMREAKPYEYFWSVPGFIGPLEKKRFVKKAGVEGYLGEGPCSPAIDKGQFASWKKVGDIKAAFFGHDHLNDFTGVVDDIILGQNKTSGFHAYTDGCRATIRTITIDESAPDVINTEIHHFKDFGLKSESLGFIQRHFSDRTLINTNKIIGAILVLGGVIGIGALIKYFMG
jgi:hypothetical protein